MEPSAESLLDGPRGRRLCLELAMELDAEIRTAVFVHGHHRGRGRGNARVVVTATSGGVSGVPAARPLAHLAASLASVDLTGVDDRQIDAALRRSVDTARYWQEPDVEDAVAELPIIRAALTPLAEHLMAAPECRWWREAGRIEQWAIDWRVASDPAPLPREPSRTLAAWARTERAEEERAGRDRPGDPRASWSGNWWSIPHGRVQTVGRMPAGLGLVEDSQGWEHATAIPVHGAGRTFELRTADDWASLCREYPMEVTASRRHDWFRTTGRNGRWVIPDWERVAGEWDAVHLTVLGYLGGATRALPVDAQTASVIAGWNPDSTIWLTDVAREAEGPRQAWRRASLEDTWSRGQ